MLQQEQLYKELIEIVSYATQFAVTDGSDILTSPVSRESNIPLYALLMDRIPLLLDPETLDPITEFSLRLNADPRDRPMGVNIALVGNILHLTSWGGIREIDGQPERYPVE